MTAENTSAELEQALAAKIAEAFPAAGWLTETAAACGEADYVAIANRAGYPPEFAPAVKAAAISLNDLRVLLADGLDFDASGSEYLNAVAETADDLADSLKWFGWATGDSQAEQHAKTAVKAAVAAAGDSTDIP